MPFWLVAALPCLPPAGRARAKEEGRDEARANARVPADRRVAALAAGMQGFEGNIGKCISRAYLKAGKDAF